MMNAIIETLKIMGWLGLVLAILAIVNMICGTASNISNGEDFNSKKLSKGILKMVIFYMSAVFTSIAFTILPYINTMITNAFGAELISSELLNILSSVAILGVVIASVVAQGKKALENVTKLSTISSDVEKITWEVEEEEETENE